MRVVIVEPDTCVLHIGDRVVFTHGGDEHTGTLIAFIPAGVSPLVCVSEDYAEKLAAHKITGPISRDDSVIVDVDGDPWWLWPYSLRPAP